MRRGVHRRTAVVAVGSAWWFKIRKSLRSCRYDEDGKRRRCQCVPRRANQTCRRPTLPTRVIDWPNRRSSVEDDDHVQELAGPLHKIRRLADTIDRAYQCEGGLASLLTESGDRASQNEGNEQPALAGTRGEFRGKRQPVAGARKAASPAD